MSKKIKYTQEFKLKLVKSVLEEHNSISWVVKTYNLHKINLELWLKLYQAHGAAGLVPSKKKYTPELKIQAVRCTLGEQLSLTEACVRFGISRPCVLADWLRKYRREGIEGLSQETRGRKSNHSMPPKTPKQPPIKNREEELSEENKYLKAENAFLKKWYALIQQEEKEKNKKR